MHAKVSSSWNDKCQDSIFAKEANLEPEKESLREEEDEDDNIDSNLSNSTKTKGKERETEPGPKMPASTRTKTPPTTMSASKLQLVPQICATTKR